MHAETVASFEADGRMVDVVLCWQGKEPEDDGEKFYDFYDAHGKCLNEGSPWYLSLIHISEPTRR